MSNLYIMLLIGTLLGSIGALFLKLAGDRITSIVSVFTNWRLYLGGFTYIVAAILNIIVLKYMPYSVVMPLTSITYIWTTIISVLFLKEKVSKYQIIGILCILTGSIVIAL